MTTQRCPLCGAEVVPSPRYPRDVCMACAGRAASIDGRLLTFANVDGTGGFVARYADTGADYPSHECWIDGVACRADERYAGGIVIQPLA